MDSTMMLLYVGAMILIMWLFFIRPQTKKAKEQANFSSGVQKGDKVVTSGGIHGKVLKDDGTTILLEIDNNTKMRIEKSAISMELTKAAYGGDTEKKPESNGEKKS